MLTIEVEVQAPNRSWSRLDPPQGQGRGPASLKNHISWTMQNSKKTARPIFAELIKIYKIMSYHTDFDDWSWSSSSKLKLKSSGPAPQVQTSISTSTSTFNFNFNSNTHEPYMILKALNKIYKIVSGTLLSTLHCSGEKKPQMFWKVWSQNSNSFNVVNGNFALSFLQVEVELGCHILQCLSTV